jgi:hypothetical protein
MLKLWSVLAVLTLGAGGTGTSASTSNSSANSTEGGSVKLPLEQYDLLRSQAQAPPPEVPPFSVCPIDRRIEGEFQRGLFKATLVAHFVVLGDPGHVRVPVLDGNASLGEVKLDGQTTSLLREGDLYTVGVDKPGPHELKLGFYWGREQDRFTRRIQFKLPEGGPTSLSVLIPEQDIEAFLKAGALSGEQGLSEGTRLEGHLDAQGRFDLSWVRRLTHRSQEEVKLEAHLNAILTLHEALVSGHAIVNVSVLQGETGRVDLVLPDGVEVVKVEGPAVLQWRTEASPRGHLTVLLRYLVEDHTQVSVDYQYPVDLDAPVPLKVPLTDQGVALSGAVGVQAPAGLEVSAAQVQNATELSVRDTPPELTDLSPSPLLSAFSFTAAPSVSLKATRKQEVELTSTLIDELQASSVVLEGGLEVTKIKLRIRNNTRQYLSMKLPEGAQLTQSLIDGEPVRPAVLTQNSPVESVPPREVLLLPLRQSERVGAGQFRTHVVQAGDTLGGIASFYYSDLKQAQHILDDNRDTLPNENRLRVGQRLRIAIKAGTTVEESSFVIELAYKRRLPALGKLGQLALELPELDVDTTGATWHVYLPHSISPLRFDSNLTQYSAIRYDPFRRVRNFLDHALWEKNAWASEAKYKSILKRRKEIFHEEERKAVDEEVLSTFPLVGERYRFKRILLGKEVPRIQVTYASEGLAHMARWLAFLATLVLGVLALGTKRQPHWVAVLLIGIGALLFQAHYFLGTHRRLIWGFDVALMVVLLWPKHRSVLDRLHEWATTPWQLWNAVSWRNLFFLSGLYVVVLMVLEFPLLLSTALLAVLGWVRWRNRPSVASPPAPSGPPSPSAPSSNPGVSHA